MKPFKTISQQLALLESRGMLIEDRVVAAHALETIGYYRLSGYSYPFRKRLADVIGRDQAFVEGTRFADVLSLYAFDVKLRSAVFAQLACIEIALRSWIGNEVGKIDPAMHLDVTKLGPTALHVEKRSKQTRSTTDRVVGVSCRFGWLFNCLIGARCRHYSPCSHAVFRMRLWQVSVSRHLK